MMEPATVDGKPAPSSTAAPPRAAPEILTAEMPAVLAVLSLGVLCGAEAVQYPDNFRRWVHLGTGIILPGGQLPESEQRMHRIFANQKAVEGYASGEFADGPVIVYELRHAPQKNGNRYGRRAPAIRTIDGPRPDRGCRSRRGKAVLRMPLASQDEWLVFQPVSLSGR